VFSVSVPDEGFPPATVDGLSVNVAIWIGLIVRDALFEEPPSVAVIVAMTCVETGATSIVIAAEV
jgi:hypothetical protein